MRGEYIGQCFGQLGRNGIESGDKGRRRRCIVDFEDDFFDDEEDEEEQEPAKEDEYTTVK